MTCVIGIETPSGVVMAADSLSVQGWAKDFSTTEKIFRVGPFTIGGCGHMRATQLVRHTLKVQPPAEDPDLYPYMVGEFVPALRACLSEGGYAHKENEVETARESSWLVGVNKQLFYIGSDYCTSRSKRGYDAIGSGSAYACGVLHALADEHPLKQCEVALSAAAEHNIGVAPPFLILEPR